MVTVITPTFNSVKTLPNLINSVSLQGDIVLEHIIIDDGSTDGTRNYLENLVNDHPKLVALFQENMGAGVARNRGIKSAKGKYIAFLDSDDLWRPKKLSVQVDFMEKRKAYFSYGDYDMVDSLTGLVISTIKPPESLNYNQLLYSCPIGCLTVMFNQEVIGKKYMPDIKRGQDWALWLKLLREGLVAYKYPGNYAVYNYSENSLSKNKLYKTLDMYKIYRYEEGLSVVLALFCLVRHMFYVFKKNRLRK